MAAVIECFGDWHGSTPKTQTIALHTNGLHTLYTLRLAMFPCDKHTTYKRHETQTETQTEE